MLAFGAAALAIGFALATLVEPLPFAVQVVPLAVSVVFLGLPHGAVDHLVLPRARGERATRRSIARLCVAYIALAAVYALLWLLAPVVAFVGFIALTIFHWGQGDVYALVDLLGADHLETRAQRALALCVRGGIPMLVPLAAFPEQYAFVASAVVGLFDPAAAAALEPAFTPTARRWIIVGVGALVVGSLGWGLLRAGPSRSWLLDAGETVGLVAFFAVVPPVLAVGLYFACWHSIRHVLRTLLVDDVAAAALERHDGLPAATRRFARDAAPMTAGALVVLGGLALTVPQTPATPTDLLGVYLVCLAVLTLPHAAVVSLLDREQGLWARRSDYP
ncbi:beta-carotene 15,15'-monooxygenase [Natrarchaeobaculum aegyptiacum]|uniref:Probable beta-carotene 15,15'-dioxygenase n=1 Tax=Natrarchaeobaculum aegyptiacum TaxID=745377 RepID=A0A2Z2HY11_9EURY|nr:beta-carotene 15,15'-monooxygenase [Natrarchaeobaculum aegyptiacum]